MRTCGSAHKACMTRTCSVERLPRLWKFSLWPVNSTSLQPNADPEPDPAAGQQAERGRLLRHQDRLALRQDQHTHGKADLAGAAGYKAKQHKRVVIRVGGGADAAAAVIGLRIDPEHAVGGPGRSASG